METVVDGALSIGMAVLRRSSISCKYPSYFQGRAPFQSTVEARKSVSKKKFHLST